MPNIKPVSDLRNYYDVLQEVHENEPVYLTKNGHGAFVVTTVEEYEEYQRLKAAFWLKSQLEEAVNSDNDIGTLSEKQIRERFEV